MSGKRDEMKGSFLGPEYSNSEIEKSLKSCGAVFHKLDKNELIEKVANALAEKKQLVGCRVVWVVRALGCRSVC